MQANPWIVSLARIGISALVLVACVTTKMVPASTTVTLIRPQPESCPSASDPEVAEHAVLDEVTEARLVSERELPVETACFYDIGVIGTCPGQALGVEAIIASYTTRAARGAETDIACTFADHMVVVVRGPEPSCPANFREDGRLIGEAVIGARTRCEYEVEGFMEQLRCGHSRCF